MTIDNTHEHKKMDGQLEGESRRTFMRAVLNDLRALERMLADGAFERGVSRIGAPCQQRLDQVHGVAGVRHWRWTLAREVRISHLDCREKRRPLVKIVRSAALESAPFSSRNMASSM